MMLSGNDFVIHDGLAPFKMPSLLGLSVMTFIGIEVDSRRDRQIRLVHRRNGVIIEEVRTGVFFTTGMIPQSITRRWYKRMERWRKELLA